MKTATLSTAAWHRNLDESSRHLQNLCSDYLTQAHLQKGRVSALQKQLQADRREIKNAWRDQLDSIKQREAELEERRATWLKGAMRETSNLDQQLRSEADDIKITHLYPC